MRAGWAKALRGLGNQTREFDIGGLIDFFERAHVKDDDGVFHKPLGTFEDSAHCAADALFADVYRHPPDVLIVVSGFWVPAGCLPIFRNNGVKVVYLFTESPYQDDEQSEWAQYADLSIVNDPIHLDRFPKGTYYQPHSFDGDTHYPGTGARTWDFSFCGTGYGSRVEFFEQIDFGTDRVKFSGNWASITDTDSPLLRYFDEHPEYCMPNAETADLYRATKISANMYRREANRDDLAQGWAMGPREVELAACETFMLRDPRPEGDEVFAGLFPTFTSPEEFSDQYGWWSAHDDEREAVARKASSAIADRTFENAARRLLSTIT